MAWPVERCRECAERRLAFARAAVAWVLLLEALHWPAQPMPTPGQRVSASAVARQGGTLMLAVISAAGLALTHYRIAMLYAVAATC